MIYRGEDNSYYEKFLATREVKCIDEEIPFEIPATWEWCRLLSIVSLLGDGIHGTPEYSEGGSVYFINGNNLFDGQILIKPDTKTVSKEEAVKHSRLLNESTVLVSINGTIGNIAFYSGENVILGKSACYFNLLNGIERKYIKIVLQTDYFLEYTKRVATGSTIKNVPLSGMRNVLIPIPPKDEQQVIIDKLSSLKLLIEKFNIEQSQLNKLNAELRSVLKKSILQEAIQGKLLPQITEEGTAQELLEQIRQEKQRLVKEGKLKKSALLDSIIYKGDDNKYYERINGQIIEIELSFEYPNSWAVLRLKDICQLIDGEKKNEKGICLDAKYLRGKSSAIIVEKGKFVYTGDNIILVDGENSGEVFTVPQDGYMGSTFKQLWLSSAMWKPYILAFILFYKEDLRNSKRGAAIPHLNKELFYNLPIGIPPYQEQQRIAKRINKLSQLLK
ncbi:restriction endonuclease subunit S [Odoribacter splanchnicus]|nr:restriction endonuclease subunit S [Alistipes finegoldii]RHL86922.1 restriction endonuclease subunit S [Odoribacter splanchnicus]